LPLTKPVSAEFVWTCIKKQVFYILPTNKEAIEMAPPIIELLIDLDWLFTVHHCLGTPLQLYFTDDKQPP